MVSIDPYHRGKAHLLEFEDYKWLFLEKEILLTWEFEGSLLLFIQEAMNLEQSARGCYSDVIAMSSTDFIQMMILDGLFIIEFFRQICESVAHDSVIIKPSVIPILMADLLKIENQLPFTIVLEFASITMASLGCGNIHSIYELIIDVFRQFILMPKELSLLALAQDIF
ncbi:hypothetical protein L1049_013439 [Liquidambar formosana]|uniref:Uncharacterized protein n=1 Tax=Liquidambar formosana TaxID=63359 RepID=A0AAP0WUA3_LIQFO